MESAAGSEASGTRLVAVYERTISASVARIWENVLDWDHLPWLHRSSFTGVELLEESAAGWRGWVASRGRRASSESLVDVRLDRPALRYLTHTAEGSGKGTEIWTRVEPIGERITKIAVEFHAPDLGAEEGKRLGAAYVELYARLWSEDEAMMVRRQAVLDESGGRLARAARDFAPVPLGPFAALRARLPLVIRAHGREPRFLELDGEIVAHPTVCPHLGGPLA
ncbi:MAG: SRPBCC family protein, partial [Candidatus Binatia bacterium]